MVSLEREYYRLSDAAKELNCSPDDLVHLAVIGRTRLGVVFTNDDIFDPVHVIEETTTEAGNTRRDLVPFRGHQSFAYVHGDDLAAAERAGTCWFSYATLRDGRQVWFGPSHYEKGINHATVDQLFMHRDELAGLLARQDRAEDNEQLTEIVNKRGVGIAGRDVKRHFQVKPDFIENKEYWDRRIGDPPKWLAGARLDSGRPGAGSRWDPLLVAHALLHWKEMKLEALDRAIHQDFADLFAKWKEETDDLRETKGSPKGSNPEG